jgi:probable phosphoglycerate mutase
VPASRRTIMLCLIQCGETAWEAERRMHGHTDLPLSEAGRAALLEDVRRLRCDRVAVVHHPPDEAATDTAHIVARRLGARTRAVSELAEPNLGLLEGLTEDQFGERFPTRHRQWIEDPGSFHAPEGDSLLQAARRIQAAVARILKRSRSRETAIVLHRLALGNMRCWLAARPLSDLHIMLAGRPRVERYALMPTTIDDLEHEAAEAPAS